MCISFPQRVQIDAPIPLISAAAARLFAPSSCKLQSLRRQLPSPLNYNRISLWPAQLQRAAIGCAPCPSLVVRSLTLHLTGAAAVSNRLITPPTSCRVSAGRTRRWAACVKLRFVRGLAGRVQVGSVVCIDAARWLLRLFDHALCSKV